MPPEPAQTKARGPAAEALLAWTVVMLGLASLSLLGRAVPVVGGLVGAAAVAAFLYAPTPLLERRGQDPHDVGWRFDHPGRQIAWGLLACLVVLPSFAVGFALFLQAQPLLPAGLRALLSPYLAAGHPLSLRLPHTLGGAWELLGRVLGNAAVALSEEYFYRGYLTARLEERWPPRTRILGAPLGRAALLAAGLFAVGHLLEPAPWRLFVFFPALLFAWLRGKTNGILAPAVCHWLCNVCLMLLELAAFGRA